MKLWPSLLTNGCIQFFHSSYPLQCFLLSLNQQHNIQSARYQTKKRDSFMTFLAVRALSKSYGAMNVLNEISCIVNAGDRIGIVGSNGVGKSTLLKILVGHEEAESGTFSYALSLEVGYLSQTTPEFYGRTIQDLILESVWSHGSLRQLEERMRHIEVSLTTAGEAQIV